MEKEEKKGIMFIFLASNAREKNPLQNQGNKKIKLKEYWTLKKNE